MKKKTSFVVLLSFIKWFAGFFEDQHGSGSSKRIALFVNTLCLYQQNQYSMQVGARINFYILMVLFVIELVLLGVIAKEFFLKYGIPLISSKTSTETNLKEETQIKNEEVVVQDPNLPVQ